MPTAASRILTLLSCVLLLPGCIQERSPQAVTQDFWHALVVSDAKGVAEYSTLSDPAGYDGYGRNWQDVTPSIGEVAVDGEQARVATVLSGQHEAAPLQIDTHLVRVAGEWKVDYARTGNQLTTGSFGALGSALEQFGRHITQQSKAASDGFAVSMQRMSEQLAEASRTLGQQTSKDIGTYGAALRRSMDALAGSTEKALREERQRLSEHEQQILAGVAANLKRESQALSDMTLESLARGTDAFAAARSQLDAIDSKALRPYLEQWRQWGERIEAETEKMVDDLAQSGPARQAERE